MFLYFAISGPGSSNDRVAIHHKIDGISLHDRIHQLPGNYIIVADAAYQPTEHVVPIFYGTQRQNRDHDNFNFVASIYIQRSQKIKVKVYNVSIKQQKFTIVVLCS